MADEHQPEELELRADAEFAVDGIPLARPVANADAAVSVEPVHEIFLEDSSRRAVCLDIVVVLLGLVVLEVLSEIAISFATGIGELPDDAAKSDINKIMIMAVMPARAVIVTILVALVLSWRNQSLRSVGISIDRLGVNLLLGLVSLGIASGFIFSWGIALQFFAPATAQSFAGNADAIMSFLPRQAPIHFAWMFLAVGLWEELLFRGFLMTRLRRLTGGWTWAAIASSILFVVPHVIDQKAIALVPISMLAAVFCLVTIWRRSIVPAIVAHWLFDFSTFLFLYYFASGDSWQ